MLWVHRRCLAEAWNSQVCTMLINRILSSFSGKGGGDHRSLPSVPQHTAQPDLKGSSLSKVPSCIYVTKPETGNHSDPFLSLGPTSNWSLHLNLSLVASFQPPPPLSRFRPSSALPLYSSRTPLPPGPACSNPFPGLLPDSTASVNSPTYWPQLTCFFKFLSSSIFFYHEQVLFS